MHAQQKCDTVTSVSPHVLLVVHGLSNQVRSPTSRIIDGTTLLLEVDALVLASDQLAMGACIDGPDDLLFNYIPLISQERKLSVLTFSKYGLLNQYFEAGGFLNSMRLARRAMAFWGVGNSMKSL